MNTILNVNCANGYIKYPFQVVNTPESFMHIMESNLGENFEVANDESQKQLDKFTSLLAFLGWSADDWWSHLSFCKQELKIFAHADKIILNLNSWDHFESYTFADDTFICSSIEAFKSIKNTYPNKAFSLSEETKRLLEEAIEYYLCGYGKVEYLEDSMSFKVTEFVPKPVYVGGSIDSIEFDELVSKHSIEDTWKLHLAIQEGERMYNPGSNRYEEEEIELPF